MTPNIGSTSLRQKALRIFYPVLTKAAQLFRKNTVVLHNESSVDPNTSLYDLTVALNNGTYLPLHELEGLKILFVNTASDCGYTAQYSELQQLQDQHPDKLRIIGFPANDFKEQESGNDAAIAAFCQVNYGITFPLAKRSSVVKSPKQNPIYQWLTEKGGNGWNEKAPSWNFAKYLVNEHGILTHYFDPAIVPLGPEILKAITT